MNSFVFQNLKLQQTNNNQPHSRISVPRHFKKSIAIMNNVYQCASTVFLDNPTSKIHGFLLTCHIHDAVLNHNSGYILYTFYGTGRS
jgi:hypothetical protein